MIRQSLPDVVRGVAPVSHADAGMEEPLRVSLAEPRRKQDLSGLDAHATTETPLQHAVKTVAGLIAPRHLASDGESAAGHPVDDLGLKHYVRASLGMEHDAARIDPGLAPYLDQLSRNDEAADWGSPPVTRGSFALLCVLHVADQAPGPAAYGRLNRQSFMDWLTAQLPPETPIPHDCIPDSYFDEVQVRRQPETGFTNRCVVEFGDGAEPVEVRSMRRADLRNLDLGGVDLRGVDLRGADLGGANLESANLEGANLQDANLQGARASYANLQHANLRGADLRRAVLENADLRGADLRRAILENANLRGADLRRAVLGQAFLLGAQLQGAHLEGAYLENTHLDGADLQGAHLDGAYLENTHLGGAYLRGASLQGAQMSVRPESAVSLVFGRRPLDLTGVRLVMPTWPPSLCQYDVEERMGNWSAAEFDVYLNHRNNAGRGVLKNIAVLDDSSRDIKQALMRAVVEGLDRVRRRGAAVIDRLIPSLGDVLFEDPEYLRDRDAFSAWLCAGLLGDGSTLLDEELTDAALDAVGGHVARLLIGANGVEAIAGHSVAIYQVLYAMRERASPPASLEVREKWIEQSQALHEQYCRVLGDALPTLMGEGGVYENERDAILADDDAFPLIAADADGRLSCVIMNDLRYRQLVLGVRFPGEMNCAWADLRCVTAGADGTFPVGEGGTRGTAAIIDRFPLLRAASRDENAAVEQGRMLALAGLEAYPELNLLERFTAALQLRSISDPNNKMINDEHQLKLGEIFETKYRNRGEEGAQLLPEHFTALKAQWPDDTDRTFAFRLLCMAALYTNYSSSRFFGVEGASPNALRGYSEALLRKAQGLAPELLPVDQLKTWVAKLNGQDFDCTAVLYGMESTNLANILRQEPPDGPLHQVWDAMIPRAWREGRE